MSANYLDDKAVAYQQNHAESPAYWQADILWTILADDARTDGSFSLLEELCPKDSGAPPHWHEQQEGFYLIDGTATFLVDGNTIQATAGAFILVPRGAVHSFRIDSETCRLLNWYVPAGFERTISELGIPTEQRVLPPKGLPVVQDAQKALTLFKEVGMHPVQGPDTLREGSARVDSALLSSDPQVSKSSS